MKEKIKDILIRTGKTFIQGFLGALAVILPNSDYTDEAFLKSALIGALAGGVCAVMNAIIKMLENNKTNYETFLEDELLEDREVEEDETI